MKARLPLYCPAMISVIVGTAGHIDHGKTALVKALTGIDADRLEEEKRRGITIDIGFANLEITTENGEKLRLGFIDVPGHERFVRNMLAGVGGIDLVLLVIAADESIKPQTREHFDICRLLKVQRGITVITKSDAVDRETLDVVRLEVEEFIRGSFLENPTTIVAVSSLSGAGIDDLKQQLEKIASEIPARDPASFTRLPIDRVFTMKGFGTVVTGTLISGTIRTEDELECFPGGRMARVRGIQVHGRSAAEAVAGQRTALNLAGISIGNLARGMTLASPATFQAASRLDVTLSLLFSAKPLKHRTKVHFHAYTTESIAEVLLYGETILSPGGEGFAQLKLSEPALLLPGDRFVIRQFSPVLTIGGGKVLNNAVPGWVKSPEHVDFVHSLNTPSKAASLRARVMERGTRGLSITEAVAQAGWRPEEIIATAREIPDITCEDQWLIGSSPLEILRSATFSILDAFHKNNPLVAGMSSNELSDRLPAHPAPVFDKLIEQLAGEKKIEVAGDVIRLPGRGVSLKDDEAEARKIIESAFCSTGLKVPALKDVLAGLKVDKVRAQKIVTLLLREKILVKISDDLVFHAEALEELRRRVAAEKAKSPKIDIGHFKELAGVSRKYAIPLLEYLDRERVTRRVGDERIIV